MENMVELRGVTKRFGNFVAVDDVSLDVRGGEFLTLLGPSGCGKTTLLRLISGFEMPDSGAVLLAGRDVTHLPPNRRDVNQVFQSYALFPHLSVWDNLAFGLKMKHVPRGELRERVERAVALVSLSGMERRKPHELSGGQRQRVALARALVCEPKVLLLDEPLSALDAKLRRTMQVELKRLQARLGITFLFVTHDQEEALVMSDRVAVVNGGKIEQIAPAAEIYHQPRTRFVADFIGQANIFPAKVQASDGTGRVVQCENGLTFAAQADEIDPGAAVFISIRPEKLRLCIAQCDEQNTFEAIVREELFRGATAQLLIETSQGAQLTVVLANVAGPGSFRPGQRVYVKVRREDIVVLPR